MATASARSRPALVDIYQGIFDRPLPTGSGSRNPSQSLFKSWVVFGSIILQGSAPIFIHYTDMLSHKLSAIKLSGILKESHDTPFDARLVGTSVSLP